MGIGSLPVGGDPSECPSSGRHSEPMPMALRGERCAPPFGRALIVCAVSPPARVRPLRSTRQIGRPRQGGSVARRRRFGGCPCGWLRMEKRFILVRSFFMAFSILSQPVPTHQTAMRQVGGHRGRRTARRQGRRILGPQFPQNLWPKGHRPCEKSAVSTPRHAPNEQHSPILA